jgi:GNAT superfamily N-acetyltransferase
VIRPVVREDGPALARLEVRAWRWAYVDFVDDANMITVEGRERRWREEPIDGAWVKDDGSGIAGVVQVGPDPRLPETGRLRGLYVEPAAQGAGLGTALYEHALAELRRAAHPRAVLWVFEANGHARGFYERRGWREDGERGTSSGTPGLRMAREL